MNKKIFGFVAFFALAAVPTWMVVAAEETEEVEEFEEDEDSEVVDEAVQKVVARVTCDEIKVKLAELRAIKDPKDAELDEIDYLTKKQRSQCASQGRSRPVRNYFNMSTEEIIEEIKADDEPVVQEEKPKKKTKKKAVTESEKTETANTEPVKTQKEIDAERAANMANGLCGDGSKPNKFGCCEGEKFKDLGNLKFACCPKEGDGECHAPIKK